MPPWVHEKAPAPMYHCLYLEAGYRNQMSPRRSPATPQPADPRQRMAPIDSERSLEYPPSSESSAHRNWEIDPARKARHPVPDQPIAPPRDSPDARYFEY